MEKSRARDIIEATFESKFDKNKFIIFITQLLKDVEGESFIHKGAYLSEAYKDYIKTFERIGKFNTDNKEIDVLIVELKDAKYLERARSMQRNFIASYLNGSRGGKQKDAALVAFYATGANDWRFSFVKMDYNIKVSDNNIKIEKEFSSAKRFSFLVGENEKIHTAESRFLPLIISDNKPSFADIEKAFDVEVVSDEFFKKYRDLFIKLKIELDNLYQNDEKINKEFKAKNITTVDFAKKLLGQIIFLYFLQKKGWFGVDKNEPWGSGPKNFIRKLFNKDYISYNNFYNEILEPLFYEALRTDRACNDHFYDKLKCKIPFLNGGLFDPINSYDWVNTEIKIPNEIFSNNDKTKEGDGILDIFDRYNFTVNEEEPLEKEVALDPELLGKIYEKLNAIRDDNFDEYLTALKSGKAGEETKFNKEYGVYYTPREIVHYICQESLINYLYTNLNGKVPKDDIDFLVKNVEISEEYEAIALEKEKKINNGYQKGSEYESKLPESIKIYAKDIDILLSDITVCDPAIGSGAFPIGMLHEIIRLRKLLAVFHNSNMDFYDIKRQCIEKTLYGVDIDAGAIETCKLRFWLSLIVDEDDFSNIRPLPNLDYKIVCGNSLIGINVDLFNNDDLILLSKYEKEFFNETNPINKLGLKKLINDLINRITDGKSVFDFKIYFQEVFLNKGGFDVVIGNPPYIGEKGHKEIFEKVKNGTLCDFYVGKMDYFYFFFHLALNIVRDNGIIAFITTNYYITALGGKKLREDLYNRATIKKLINFNELKIFESATGQHNMITILQKGKNKNELANTCITHRKGHATSEILQKILSGDDDETDYYQITQENLYDGNEHYIRLIPNDNEPIQIILDKIKAQGIYLGIICNVNQGIVTGADKVSKKHINEYDIKASVGEGIFVLSDDEVKRLNLTPKEREILKPWFKNSDIGQYFSKDISNEYLLDLNYTSRPDINNYPNIKAHLLKFKSMLKVRPTPGTLMSAFSKDMWWVLTTSRKQDFNGPKIVAPQRSPRNTFGYNEIPWYAASDVFFITEKDKSISLKYVLALLNSKLYYIWLYYRGKRKGEILELIAKPLSEIPIKKIAKEDQQPFIDLVDKILAITKDDDYLENPVKQEMVKEYERQIDQMVYKLYDLTEEEIKIVEGGN